jgi:hypothetical protein
LRSMGRFLPGVPRGSLKIAARSGDASLPSIKPHGKL